MNKIIFSFLITFLAGISTMIGVIPIYLNKRDSSNIICCSLAFSAGVMLTISFFSLIPEATFLLKGQFNYFPLFVIIFIFVVCGILFSSIIDQRVEKVVSNNNLYKLGIISVIVLILHNIPEGITTFTSTTTNLSLGLSLSLGIALHNIPEGISIAVPIYYSTKSKLKAILLTLISGFSELFGAVIAYLFIARYVNDFIFSMILAVTAGIMIHISVYEIIPNFLLFKKRRLSVLFFVLGVILMIICDTLL